jgi:hypothetical protein
MTTGGFQLSLRCQPEPVFIQALQAPAVSHCKKSGKPSPSSKMRIIDVTGDGLPDISQCASSSEFHNYCSCVWNIQVILTKISYIGI